MIKCGMKKYSNTIFDLHPIDFSVIDLVIKGSIEAGMDLISRESQNSRDDVSLVSDIALSC
jgi:hypothetical protein